MSRALRAVLAHGVRRGLGSRAGFVRSDFERRGPSRREFLAASLAASGAAMAAAAGCAERLPRGRRGEDFRVVVIGGGLGGLACADELVRRGANVVVFEAESRVGGRVDTDRELMPGSAVERGGQLVGANHPTWRSLAARFKLPLVEAPSDEGESAVVLDGRAYRGQQADALYADVDAALAHVIELAAGVNAERPYASPGAHELDARSVGAFFETLAVSPEARRLLAVAFESDNGVPTERASLLGYLSMVKGGGLGAFFTDSEALVCGAGSDALATALAGALGPRVYRGHLATAVDRRVGTVTTRTRAGAVTTWPADAVVLAIPPTRWNAAPEQAGGGGGGGGGGRERGIYFSPALPAGLAPQMGKNTKLVAVYPRPVWKEAGISSEVLMDGAVSQTWIAARGRRAGAGKGGEGDAGKSAGEVALALFSGGTGAETMHEFPAPHRAARGTIQLDQLVSEATSGISRWAFYDWPGDPRTRGSYTFPAPGHITTHGKVLVEGFERSGVTPMYFAGEHASYAFPGYMEGALSSGVRVARQVISGAIYRG